jgi:hypothetical protein
MINEAPFYKLLQLLSISVHLYHAIQFQRHHVFTHTAQLLRVLVQGLQEGVDTAILPTKGERAWLKGQQAKLVLQAGSFASPAGRRRTSRAPIRLQPTEAPAMRVYSDSKYKRQVRSWPSTSNPKPMPHEREAKRYYDDAKELLQATATVANELVVAGSTRQTATAMRSAAHPLQSVSRPWYSVILSTSKVSACLLFWRRVRSSVVRADGTAAVPPRARS